MTLLVLLDDTTARHLMRALALYAQWCRANPPRMPTDLARLADALARAQTEPPEEAGYAAMHARLKALRGPASQRKCAHCGKSAQHWAYDHQERYIPLCAVCHVRFDRDSVASNGHKRPHLAGGGDPADAAAVLPDALDYRTAADRLSVSDRTVRRLVKQGDLPAVDIGGCRRIRSTDLAAYVEGLAPGGEPDAQ